MGVSLSNLNRVFIPLGVTRVKVTHQYDRGGGREAGNPLQLIGLGGFRDVAVDDQERLTTESEGDGGEMHTGRGSGAGDGGVVDGSRHISGCVDFGLGGQGIDDGGIKTWKGRKLVSGAPQ